MKTSDSSSMTANGLNTSMLFITKEFSEKTAGGAGVYAYELTKAMANQDITLHILATGQKTHIEKLRPNLIVHWYKTINLPLLRVPSHHILVWLHSAKLVKKYNIQTIHSNNFDGAFATRKIPMITTIHHPAREEIKHAPPMQRPIYYADLYFENCVLRKSSSLVAVSHATKTALTTSIKSKPIVVLPNGINLNDFNVQKKSSLRRKLGIKKDKLILFFPGGARAKRKGALILLEALEGVASKNFKVVISGISREMGWQREFDEALRNSPVGDRFMFVKEIDYAELPQYYSDSDIVVYPSMFEGFGLPALEALACGKPLICTKTGEMPYIVKNGVNGLLVDTGDPSGLRDAINRLMSSKAARKELEKNATRSIMKYSWDSTATEVIAIHRKTSRDKKT